VHSCCGRLAHKQKLYVFARNFDSQRAPVPAGPRRQQVVHKFRNRVNHKIGLMSDGGDADNVVDDIKNLANQFEDLCDELFPDDGTNNDKCRAGVKAKQKRGRRRANDHGDNLDDLNDDLDDLKEERDAAKRKQRVADAAPIIAQFKEDLEKKVGDEDVFETLTLVELRHRIRLLAELKKVAIHFCKKLVVGGISPQCSGRILEMAQEVSPDLQAAKRRAEREEQNADD
jgi:hypothetical protein